jgi:hypothetical protein
MNLFSCAAEWENKAGGVSTSQAQKLRKRRKKTTKNRVHREKR